MKPSLVELALKSRAEQQVEELDPDVSRDEPDSQEIRPGPKPADRCKLVGCDRKGGWRGYCHPHYRAWRAMRQRAPEEK